MVNTPRYALKFAYNGSLFEGYARQPGMHTVEGDIIAAMTDMGMITDARSANFQTGSRTDKGVSAAGNVIAISTDFDRVGLIPALNSQLNGIRFRSLAEAPPEFNPRHAEGRHYRYYWLDPEYVNSPAQLSQYCAIFMGEHDFTRFIKKDDREVNPVLAIDDFRCEREGGFIVFDIRARRFAWQLVRRLVWTVLVLADGNIPVEDAIAALEMPSESNLDTHPAPEVGLVLKDVFYDLEFVPANGGKSGFTGDAAKAVVRARVLSELANAFQ